MITDQARPAISLLKCYVFLFISVDIFSTKKRKKKKEKIRKREYYNNILVKVGKNFKSITLYLLMNYYNGTQVELNHTNNDQQN